MSTAMTTQEQSSQSDAANDAIDALPRRVLIVENDERFADTLATEFRDHDYEVETLTSLAEVKDCDVSGFGFGVIDLRLRTDSGLDVIASIRGRNEDARLIVLTGYGSIATAVQATKLGATSYLTKPVDFEDVLHALLTDDELPNDEVPIPQEFQSLYRHEREYIEYVLARCDGNISEAARRLGLHRQSLQRKLRKYTPR